MGAGEEMLHPILQIIRERHLGDRGVDRDLQPRPIEVAQGAFDAPEVLLIGKDDDRIVDCIGGVAPTFVKAPPPFPPPAAVRRPLGIAAPPARATPPPRPRRAAPAAAPAPAP